MAPKQYSWLAPSNNATSRAIAAPIRSSQPSWKPAVPQIDLTVDEGPYGIADTAKPANPKKRERRLADNELNSSVKKRKLTPPKDPKAQNESNGKRRTHFKSTPVSFLPLTDSHLTPPKTPESVVKKDVGGTKGKAGAVLKSNLAYPRNVQKLMAAQSMPNPVHKTREIVTRAAIQLSRQPQEVLTHTNRESDIGTSVTATGSTDSEEDDGDIYEKDTGHNLDNFLGDDFVESEDEESNAVFMEHVTATDASVHTTHHITTITEKLVTQVAPIYSLSKQVVENLPSSRQNLRAHTLSPPPAPINNKQRIDHVYLPPNYSILDMQLPFELDEIDFSDPNPPYASDWIERYGTVNSCSLGDESSTDRRTTQSSQSKSQQQQSSPPSPGLPQTAADRISELTNAVNRQKGRKYLHKGAKDWSGRKVPLGH